MTSNVVDPDNPYYVHPGERSVAQSIGEGIRLYGRNFWKALLASAPPLVVASIAFSLSDDKAPAAQQAASFIAIDLAVTAAYVLSCALVLGSASRRSLVIGFLAGATVAIPTQIFFVNLVNTAGVLGLFIGVTTVVPLILAFLGLSVPVAVSEGLGYIGSLRRAVSLARADLFHLWGGMAMISLLGGMSWVMLWGLIVNMADLDSGAAAILAALVLAPLPLLLGPVLYEDQRERARPPIEEAM